MGCFFLLPHVNDVVNCFVRGNTYIHTCCLPCRIKKSAIEFHRSKQKNQVSDLAMLEHWFLILHKLLVLSLLSRALRQFVG